MNLRWLLFPLLLLAAWSAAAHRSSDAFVTLRADAGQLSGQWEIALRDLEAAIGIDQNRDRELTWGELRAAESRIAGGVLRHLQVSDVGGACALRLENLKVHDRADGPYAWLSLSGDCPGGASGLAVDYRFLFGIDPSHRAILSLADRGGVVATAVLAPGSQRFALTPANGGWLAQFTSYVREGVTHIWAGYDHILFLVTLLLPCVLLWKGNVWAPASRLSDALREVVFVVTAFTVAHSLTLGLAVFELVSLPPRLVESVIALTVALAALNNLYPVVTTRRYAVALGFGLIHGFGFASALGEIGLPTSLRLLGLAGFNIGVELGQLAIVAVVVPVLYLLRRATLYQPLVLRGGSMLIVAMACIWFVQRAVIGE